MYAITTPDAVHTREVFAEARELAETLADARSAEFEVVHTETGAVAYVATPVHGRAFNPWERVETPKFQAPHIDGLRPAYTRRRIETVVYRKIDETGWVVLDTRSNTRYDVSTTAQARAITNALGAEARA